MRGRSDHMRTQKRLRSNTHVENFTEHLFLFHRLGICKGSGVERSNVRWVANGRGGSGGVAVSLLGWFGILRSVVWRRSAWWLTWLRAGLPSTGVGLTRAAVLRGTSTTLVIRLMRLVLLGRYYVRGGGRITAPCSHAWLRIPHSATYTRGMETGVGEKHLAVYVARYAGSSGLLHPHLVALFNLALQLLPSSLTALSEADIERLGTNHLVVHLCNSFGSLFRGGVANETEALGVILFVTHDFGAGDGSEGFKLCTEFFVVNVVVEILDVEVDTMIFAHFLELGLLVKLPQVILTFGLFLSPADEKLLAIVLGVMESVDCFGSIGGILEIDESSTCMLPIGID